MGISDRGFGVDRHIRLVRAVADSQRDSPSAAVGAAESRLKRFAVRALLCWGLISLGFIWCVAGRECDYEWACFAATFFASVS
jgi:hypothetical protein